MQPSLQHTHRVSSSLLSLSVFSPILSSQLEVFLPFSLCLISLSFQLLLESINSLSLSYFLLPLMYVLVCHIFFFSYISPSNSHSFFHICTPKPLKSSPILTLISWLPGVDHLYHPAIRFFCQHTTETAILKDICLMHSFLFSAHRYHYLMILRFLDFCSTGT